MTFEHGLLRVFDGMQGHLELCCSTPSEQRQFLVGRGRQLYAMAAAVALPGRMAPGESSAVVQELQPSAWRYTVAGFLAGTLQLFQEPQRSLADDGRVAVSSVSAVAVALLSFAELDSRRSCRPSDVRNSFPGGMQLAADAARYLHSLGRLLQSSEATHAADAHAALSSQSTAITLRNAMAWLADAATPVATASTVLGEGLPALAVMVEADETTRLPLATAGGPWERVPVAAALRRRLPRRMAARFMPDVERVTVAVSGQRCGTTASMATSPDEAVATMAALQLQARAASCTWNVACMDDNDREIFINMMLLPAAHAVGRNEQFGNF